MSIPDLGYWKIRGLAEPIRYFFAYVGQEFKDTLYEQGDAPEFSRDTWLSVKFTLPLEFPNLPYLIHDEIKISESWAILRYIANKWDKDTLGKGIKDQTEVDQVQGVLNDIKRDVTMPQYMQADKKVIHDLFIDKFDKMSKYLGNKSFLIGSYVVQLYFKLLEIGNWATQGKLFETYPNLGSYHKKFSDLKGVKEHIQKSSTYKLKFNNKVAKINN